MVGILLALFMTSAPAHAGDTLYLQSGKIAVDDSMKNFEWERDRRRRKDLLRGDKKSHLFIVQFRSAITDIDKQDLETLKAHVLGYVPDDAYVVEATGVVAQTIRLSSTRVRDVLKFDPDWKIAPELTSLLKGRSEAKVDVATVAGETFEAQIHCQADLDKLADHEKTLWITPSVAAPSEDVAAQADGDDEGGTGLTVKNEKGIALGETDTYPLSVRRRSHVRIEIQYEDAPAAQCAEAGAVVNDVSISVKDPKGREYADSGPGAVLDFVAPRGSYDIQVRGENIPSASGGRQPYTIHVSLE